MKINVWKTIDAIAKILIPISVAFFAFVQNEASRRTEQSLSELSFTNQQAYQSVSTDLKLIEILWPTLVKGDSTSRISSMNLVEQLRPDLALKITLAISKDRNQPDYIKVMANNYIIKTSTSTVDNYKINIYYNANDIEARKMANGIEDLLHDTNLSLNIFVVDKDSSWFSNNLNEILYTKNTEELQANVLLSIINSVYSSFKIQLTPVNISTENALTIYISKVSFNEYNRRSTGFSPGTSGLTE